MRNGTDRFDEVYELFPELQSRSAQLAGTLSGGQQQMVAIARALLNPNRILLVDEPTKGLAPMVVAEVANALERVCRESTVKDDAVGYAHSSDVSLPALMRAADAVAAVRGGYSGSFAAAQSKKPIFAPMRMRSTVR